jgi:hypothetical protein
MIVQEDPLEVRLDPNETVTIARNGLEVWQCAYTPSPDGLMHPSSDPRFERTYVILAHVAITKAEAWQREHLPWVVPFRPFIQVNRRAERAWLKSSSTRPWSMHMVGGAVCFEDQTDAFWYKMYRG